MRVRVNTGAPFSLPTMVKVRVGLLIFVFCLPFCVYAESTDEYGRLRLKNAYWFGRPVTTGYLDATATQRHKVRLTSLAGIRVGMERW